MEKERMATYQLLIDTENVGLKWLNRITQSDIDDTVSTHLFYSDNTMSLTLDMLWGLSCSTKFVLHKCPGHLGKNGIDNLIMMYLGYLIKDLSYYDDESDRYHQILIVSNDTGYDNFIRNTKSMQDLEFMYSNRGKFVPDNIDICRGVIDPEAVEGGVIDLVKIITPSEDNNDVISDNHIPEVTLDNKRLEDLYNTAETIIKPLVIKTLETYGVSHPNLPRKIVECIWEYRNEPRVLTRVHNMLTSQFEFMEIGLRLYKVLKPYLIQINEIYKHSNK